jgi:hypothetical protein
MALPGIRTPTLKTAKGTPEYALIVLLIVFTALAISTFGLLAIDLLTLSAIIGLGIGVILINEGLFESKGAKSPLNIVVGIMGAVAIIYGIGILAKINMVISLLAPQYRILIAVWVALLWVELLIDRK